jgi:hypothetical protein
MEMFYNYSLIIVAGLLILITLLTVMLSIANKKIKTIKVPTQEVLPEGYGRFVVESREMAFNYISHVQARLLELDATTKNMIATTANTSEELVDINNKLRASVGSVVNDLLPKE